MSVHKKLMDARIKLQSMSLKKSGFNKFSNYQYFELGDFLPAIQNIFSELGLCGIVSYGRDVAILTITDIETGKTVDICSPMSEANLKGCHPVQNLGAVQTYIRRYLWVTALEIVEHDALDATTGQEGKGKGVHKPTDNQSFNPEGEELEYLNSVCMDVVSKLTFQEMSDCLISHNLDSDEKVWVWDKLDSKTRSGIKKYNAELKQKEGV